MQDEIPKIVLIFVLIIQCILLEFYSGSGAGIYGLCKVA